MEINKELRAKIFAAHLGCAYKKSGQDLKSYDTYQVSEDTIQNIKEGFRESEEYVNV